MERTEVGFSPAGVTFQRMILLGNQVYLAATVLEENTGMLRDWVLAVYDKATGTENTSLRRSFSHAGDDYLRAIVYHQPSDSFILAGSMFQEAGGASDQDWAIRRIFRDGTIDTSFSYNIDFNSDNDKINNIKLDSNNDIWAVGYGTNYTGGTSNRDAVFRKLAGP